MLNDAIRTYHDLLTDSAAADSQAHLEVQTRARGMVFGERPVCTVLRPRFMTAGQYRFLQEKVWAVLPAFHKVYERGLADAKFRQQFALRDWEESLLGIDPGFRHPSPTSRLDSFYVSEADLKFTEFNTETPAGAGYNDVLTEMFDGMPVMQEFRRHYQVRPLPARPHVAHAVLDAFRQWQGHRSDPPRVAILDWKEVPTYSEFRIFERYFREQGVDARIVDPREVEYAGGTLRAGDFAFNVIYKRVLISELLERGGADHPVVRAVRDGAVCMVNTFRCKLLYKKLSFAVVSDERNADLFTADELQAIADHVPWTRRVEERRTRFHGREIDLVPHVLANRDRFVLKPNDEYGGKGIVLGWTVDQPAWEVAVKAALAEPFVVQEKVNLPREVFPGFEGGQLQFLDRMLDSDPFVCFGEYMDACLTRISTEALLNVTAGGGSTVPTYVVMER